MEGKRQKGTYREEETERRWGKATEGRDRGEIHQRRDRGKEIEGNRHRERDIGEHARKK
jgi:hypothetical protein